jgi:hypothetical protein
MKFFGKKEAILGAALAAGSPAMSAETPKNVDNPSHRIEMSAPDKADKKDSLTVNYESHKTDSLIMEKFGPKAIYFGAEDLDSTAQVNEAKVNLGFEVNMADLEKELTRPSAIEGKTVKEALESGDYVAYMVPSEINGNKVNYENIKDLFGIKKVVGENVGNRSKETQARPIMPGLYFMALPTNDSANFNEQMAAKPKNHQVADYNEAMFALLALKNKIGNVSGRVSETSKTSGEHSLYITLPNKFVLSLDENDEIEVGGWDNSIREDGTGIWYNLRVDSK